MGPQKAVRVCLNYKRVKDDLPGVEFGELTAPGMGRGPAAMAGPRGGRAGRGPDSSR